ncbi:HdeD family acid-resistance protein [Calycomorphotria hydatis]|uniref:Acid-resistance membrane protein n=1 Tax=Calycomorphotria hydatis TaxID=2528027 RepID=A0A517TC85_9PLAN|nr:DUF308 domain-containing protein [Calycomorphotria hydatis]QDT65986.1 hypothetical protein V22_32500 [Calycomorphotria hydatis]
MTEQNKPLANAASAAKSRVEAKLGHVWWAIMLRGVLAVILAGCAFIWPEKTLGILMKLLGAYFVLDGVIAAIAAYRGDEKVSTIAQAIIGFAMGLILLFWAGISVKVFLVLVGIWLLLQGFSLLLAAYRTDPADETRGLTIGIGAVMAVIGCVFIFWTHTGVVIVSWLIGFCSLIIGAMLIFLATCVRNLHQKIQHIGNPG